jgi:hypothetical protein
MAREGLSGALHRNFCQGGQQKTALAMQNLKVIANGSTQGVDISVHPLTEPAALQGMVLVVFADATIPLATKGPGKAGKRQASARPAGRVDTGTEAGPRGVAVHPRGDADSRRNSNPPMRNCRAPTRNSKHQ